MNTYERIRALEYRLDSILEMVPDNAIYQDHDSRAILNIIQALKILKQEEEREKEKGNYEHI